MNRKLLISVSSELVEKATIACSRRDKGVPAMLTVSSRIFQ